MTTSRQKRRRGIDPHACLAARAPERASRRFAWGVLAVAFLSGACTQGEPEVSQSWDFVCIDLDGDGYGFQCAAGADCDDEDPAVHADCSRCSGSAEGCGCDEGAAPVACRLPYTLDEVGALICRSGTRYCRDGAWSDCEGVASYVVPATRGVTARARIDRGAAPVQCDPCNPDCYRLEDPLSEDADASPGPSLVYTGGGGVTLAYDTPDGGFEGPLYPEPPLGENVDELPCVPDQDSDCDGLPDAFDANPSSDGPHQTLFLLLAPGEASERTLQGPLFISAADVYFYLDTTGSMGPERDRLVADLTTGNFLPEEGADITCLDRDGDGAPDDELKTQGIVGNLACTLRDVQFGTGFFRDIPFRGPFATTGRNVAPADYEMFEHLVDITTDASRVDTALRSMVTRANYNFPEGGMQGLWALATGSGLYAGWNRPGIPERHGCPASTWGYACFRDAAFPIVVQLTDAPMQNGPPTSANSLTTPPTPANCLSNTFVHGGATVCEALEYDASVLSSQSAGTEQAYRRLTVAAEEVSSAEPVGVIDDVLLTYAGDTRAMASNVSYEQLGSACPSGQAWDSLEQEAPDVVFGFSVLRSGPYLISARGSRFDTSLVLLRAGQNGQPPTVLACGDDSLPYAWDYLQHDHAAELTVELGAGDYWVVLKGHASHDAGMFQLTLGRPDLSQSSSFAARPWLGWSGVRHALRDTALRVITMQSGTDPYLEDQARSLALATLASDSSGAAVGALTGSNTLGDSVVGSVRRLLAGVNMRVGLRLGQAFSDAFPGTLEFQAVAVDTPGDGCQGLGAPAADGRPTEHTGCRAGSRPRFDVIVRNPPGGASVPRNLDDPTGQGGYRMTLQVVGDDRYVLEEYPVYMAPTDTPRMPRPPYVASAAYDEVAEATGCAAEETARWRTLNWDTTLPAGTRATFQICTSDAESELSGCELQGAAEVTPGALCTTQSECGATGYCAETGVCHDVTGAACEDDQACGPFGLCAQLSAGRACTYTRSTVELRGPSTTTQGSRFARVRVGLHASDDFMEAPVVHRYALTYVCVARD